MESIHSRTELIIGKTGIEKLSAKNVAVIGIGGVGSWTAEALVRSGVGSITLVDADFVDKSNINRQIIALHSTIGLPKVQVMRERLLDINPKVSVRALQCFFSEATSDKVLCRDFDYVVDAIDTIRPKVYLIYRCKELGIPIISSMGAGNKLDPTAFKVTDLFKTSVCPVARIVRRELRRLGIKQGVKAVFSPEPPIDNEDRGPSLKSSTPGSMSFVPPSVGLLIASEVIRDLLS